MTPDPLQQAWQAQPLPAVDADRLIREFREKDRQFAAAIFWRDTREVGVGIVMIPVWVTMGVRLDLPSAWYLMIPGLLWIAGFLTVDRLRQRQRRAAPGEPLAVGVASSLADVEHQILLLRSVFWWYQLPLAVPMLALFAQVAWEVPGAAVWESITAAALMGTLVLGVNAWVYWLNQRAVRSGLEPRRRELVAMLQSLSTESPA